MTRPIFWVLAAMVSTAGCSGGSEPAGEGGALASIAACRKSGDPATCETAALWAARGGYGSNQQEIFSFAIKACSASPANCTAQGLLEMDYKFWPDGNNQAAMYAKAEKTLTAACQRLKDPSEACLVMSYALSGGSLPEERILPVCVAKPGRWGCLTYFEAAHDKGPAFKAWSDKACAAKFGPACTVAGMAESGDDAKAAALYEAGCLAGDANGCGLASMMFERSPTAKDPAKSKSMKQRECKLAGPASAACKSAP